MVLGHPKICGYSSPLNKMVIHTVGRLHLWTPNSICGWLNPWMPNLGIWRAHCVFIEEKSACRCTHSSTLCCSKVGRTAGKGVRSVAKTPPSWQLMVGSLHTPLPSQLALSQPQWFWCWGRLRGGWRRRLPPLLCPPPSPSLGIREHLLVI